MGEGRGGQPRSSPTEVGHAVDCNSITFIGIGDARDNHKSRWGSSRRTRAGQVTNYIHPGIIDKGSSSMGEGRGFPPTPRSARTEVGHAIDCNSITFIGDAWDNNKSGWGNSSRGTRSGQVTNYIHPGIIDKGSSLMGGGIGGPPRSSKIEAGNVVDCKSIMPTGQVEDLPLPGSPREENDDIILSRSSKSWSIEGVLVKSKVYLAGNFNVNVNLSNLTEEIESSGGIVIEEIAGADIVVVGDQSKDEDIQSMSTNTSTPRIDLELLYKVMELEVSLIQGVCPHPRAN
jgi:hypothetical protein